MTKKQVDKMCNPETMEITMNVSDIKHIEHMEDLINERPKEEYDKLLLKVYWYLKGIDRNTLTKDAGSTQLLEEIEDFIY